MMVLPGYTIHPVANAIAFMKSAADKYNEKLPKNVMFQRYTVM